ncbi:peptide chain release factor N(5)-glutamine methyltransferase [Pullulanibacillus sp. KACC 23026]|uniref:peptide chain release factor N(5)-glutamine methyltransferase n=1 Tax=Pullulanibacillus sp. KACC 23026 TaxID=3028315 RepID=UPI0023B025A4|nr:peptide chain release factor N(5)-glutamine methyltransferase [Pullulanibacillus sp. KACC 23026]WEG13099.1 peptide chain release factor N(5)-glutamine methyltransferase [Pullulanibacillus sp. KACC 23026]
MSSKRIFEALNWASSFLKERGREANAAEWLLMYRLELSRSQLLINMREYLEEKDREWFEEAVKQHGAGVPVQHIMGEASFYGRLFEVNSDVLIPRPETEELIQGILDLRRQLFGDAFVSYCDVGTGSGAIAITLALEDPNAHVTAVDLSKDALEIAKKNAVKLGADIAFEEGDLLLPFAGQRTFDIVVSNPPYIPSSVVEELDMLVRDHEPRLALDGGEDGLTPYRRLAEQLPGVLKSRPFLIGFEIGEGQGEAVKAFLQGAFGKEVHVSIQNDINKHERMVFAWMNT